MIFIAKTTVVVNFRGNNAPFDKKLSGFLMEKSGGSVYIAPLWAEKKDFRS